MNTTGPETLATWATRLHGAAARGPCGHKISDPTRAAEWLPQDELGNRRPVDRYLVTALGRGDGRSADAQADAVPSSPDVALWRMVCGGRGDPVGLLRRTSAGPLFDLAETTAIEVLTETELCGLHALWTLARTMQRPDLRARCLAAAEWHLAELQPDNATHLPWAVHVFAVIGLAYNRPDALLDAQTRLHNALTGSGSGGRPDGRSALILEHAARELDAIAAT